MQIPDPTLAPASAAKPAPRAASPAEAPASPSLPRDEVAVTSALVVDTSAAKPSGTTKKQSLSEAVIADAPAAPKMPSPAAPRAEAAPKVLLEEPATTSASALLGLATPQAAPAPPPIQASSAGFDLGSLDTTVKPGNDFFRYADGGWIDKNPIPAELPRWGRFLELNENNLKTCDQIMRDASTARAPKGSDLQKIGDFYASGMDEAAIEAAGLTPLQPQLDRIAAIQNLADLQKEVVGLHEIGVGVLFGIGSTQDAKDNTQVIGEVDQGGLGLPDRDYYFDDKKADIRAAYVDHMAKTFALMGDTPEVAQKNAETVMSLETALAEHSRTRVQLRDPEANYNKKDRAEIAALTPSFNWDSYLSDVGLGNVGSLNVGQPEFFQALDGLLTSRPLDDWKTYLRWHLIDSSAGNLSKAFVDENFHFKGTVLSGTPTIRPRWKRVVAASDSAIGDLVGKQYVERTFPPEAKARVGELIDNLKGAFRESLQSLPWMSDETRQKALQKMDAFTAKIGYPDKWKDYSALDIDRGPFVLNVQRANQHAFHQDLEKIGKPVDRTEWHMTPQTVNAYYNPLQNEIVFPAGILQPPFFNFAADDAVNYGGIGAVIGHEMTHGFDDQGAQFDGDGNLKNWWTDADLAAFHQRTDAVSALFDSFEVEPGLHVNGKLVTGEATADLGGITLAYRAFERSMQAKGRPDNIDGFSPEQRFFLGFGQIWAGAQRPEYTRMQVATDPHPYAPFRVNGTLQNLPEFGAAFGVQPGEPMQLPPDRQIKIW